MTIEVTHIGEDSENILETEENHTKARNILRAEVRLKQGELTTKEMDDQVAEKGASNVHIAN